MTALAMFSVGTQTSYADEAVLTPTKTTVIQADGKTAQNANTVLYNAEATSWRYSYAKIKGGAFTNELANYEGSPVVLTKFDASTTLNGKLLKKATLSFSSVCTVAKKNSNVQVATINTGWDATTATWTNTNTAEILNAVGINGNGDNVGTTKKELSYDVTSYLKASTNNTLGIALFTFTGREQEASDIKLALEYIDAAKAAKYTVKYVDAAGKEIKTSSTYVEERDLVPPLTKSDKEAIYNEDKTVKYVYDSDDAASLTIAADGSTVVTVKFREAAKWNYTFNAVDAEGKTLQEGIVKGTNFEGETFNVGYPYAINVDGTLYESSKLSSDKKGYYLSYTLEADNQVKDITFKPTTTTDIVFLAEAENIEGLTKATNNNTFVRSSNGGSAYAAEDDVEITTLQPGKYKLTAVICDATKNAGSEWNFLAGENNIFKFTASSVNWAQGTSEEFEVNAETPIYLVKGGNANQAVDFIYIQKTGDVEVAAYKEVNSIAELRKLEFKDETEPILVKLNLHDAHISALNKTKDSGPELLSETDSEVEGGDAAEAEETINFAILEDATGAIDISQLLQPGIEAGMISGKFELGTVLNGYLYAELNYPNALWLPEEWTEKSEFTTTPSTLVPTESTLADIVKPENDLRLFTLKDVTIKNVATEGAPDYNICQGEASIMLSDGFFNVFGETMPEKVESVTGILYAMIEEFGEAPAYYMFVPTAATLTSETPAVPVVENIAALSKIEGGEMDDPSVKLMLKNAKITYVQTMDEGIDPRAAVAFAILEDETGAVEISNIITKANASNWFEGELKEGVELNGYINVNYSSWSTALVANDETSKSELTITPTTIVPAEAKIADLQKAENNLRLFELKDVDFAVEDGAPVIKQDDASIILADQFFVLPEDMPETAKFESVVGVVFMDYESYVFCPISYTLAEVKPIEVNSIAELNKLGEENEGATIKLKLTDAQITVADASMSSAIIEDKTGAFNAQYFFAEAVGMEMLKDEFKQGVVLNGYLYAKYSYGSIEVCENTANSDITTTEAPVVPTEADFAEVLKAENNYRLYEFKGITVNKNKDDHFQLVKGDAKAEIADGTRSLEESMMATVESVVGYFRVKGDEVEFTLISYKTATPDGISSIEVAAKNAAVYNLNGAKVLGAGESVKGLAKGIYVVGGKKIVVK